MWSGTLLGAWPAQSQSSRNCACNSGADNSSAYNHGIFARASTADDPNDTCHGKDASELSIWWE